MGKKTHKNYVFSLRYDLEIPVWFTLHTKRTPYLCRDSSSFVLHEVRILRRLEILQ